MNSELAVRVLSSSHWVCHSSEHGVAIEEPFSLVTNRHLLPLQLAHTMAYYTRRPAFLCRQEIYFRLVQVLPNGDVDVQNADLKFGRSCISHAPEGINIFWPGLDAVTIHDVGSEFRRDMPLVSSQGLPVPFVDSLDMCIVPWNQ